MDFSPKDRLQCVVDSKRDLNCLFLEDFVRDCNVPSKCYKCRPNSLINIPEHFINIQMREILGPKELRIIS